MKLLLCTNCNDIIKLKSMPKICDCGKTAGKYIDDKKVVIYGPCILLGISNHTFQIAIQLRKTDDDIFGGTYFDAFVIPSLSSCIQEQDFNIPKGFINMRTK